MSAETFRSILPIFILIVWPIPFYVVFGWIFVAGLMSLREEKRKLTTADIRKAFGIGSYQEPRALKTDEEILDCIAECVTLINVFDDIYSEDSFENDTE